jgi:hypothetical protein
MRKSTLALIIVIGVLMFYTGCDGDGSGDGGDSPGVCPCDFFSVPMTAGCWVVDTDQPTFRPFPPPPSSGFESCDVLRQGTFDAGITVIRLAAFDVPSSACTIFGLESDTCPAPNFGEGPLTQSQIDDCATNLEEYATALNDAGITVTGGPPYTCIPDDAGLGFWDY